MEEPQIESENVKIADTQEKNPNNGGIEEEAGDIVGPTPAPQRRAKRPLQFEQAYLDSLPCANM